MPVIKTRNDDKNCFDDSNLIYRLLQYINSKSNTIARRFSELVQLVLKLTQLKFGRNRQNYLRIITMFYSFNCTENQEDTVEDQGVASTASNLQTGFSLLQHFTTNDDLLDLRGALVDLVDLGVSHQLLYWVLAVEAGTTENLNCIRSTARKAKSIRGVIYWKSLRTQRAILLTQY